MARDKILLVGISAALITLFLAGGYWYRSKQTQKVESAASAHGERLIRSYSPTLGKPDAPVTVVEFLDPECETCASIYPFVKTMLKDFGDKVRLVVRYMPFHKNSFHAATALEAARKQEKYWEALETLFRRQPEWASHEAPRPELIVEFLSALGLDKAMLQASMDDSEPKKKIQQDQEDGTVLGVRGTPTFFVNGKLLERLGPEPLRQAIEQALKQGTN